MGKIAPNILFHDKGMGIIMITFEKLWNNGIRDLQQIAELTDLPLEMVKELFKGKIA